MIWGCANQVGDQSANVGRSAALAAGWPETVPGTTINRACGSSQQALDFAIGMVRAGMHDLVVAGGVESMSRVPLGAGRDTGQVYGPRLLERYADTLEGGIFNQGWGAELIANRWGLDRHALDEFSALSHARTAAAIDSGAFDSQLITVPEVPDFAVDEGLRRGTTVDTLAQLKPSFNADGVVHAGNASQISDGASAVLVTTPERAAQLGLTPTVRHHTSAVSGADPVTMRTGPIPATAIVLELSGVSIDDIGTLRGQRGVRVGPTGLAHRDQGRPGAAQPAGRGDRRGPPARRLGNHPDDAVGAPHARAGSPLRRTMCEGGGMADAAIVELVT